MSNWIDKALELLQRSLNPVAQELNEIDWKSGLSDKSDRLAAHLCAFANQQGGGYLAYGIGNDGISKPLSRTEIDTIVNKLGNIARNNLEPAVGIEHAVVEFKGNPILFIKVAECQEKPVHIRGNDIYQCFTRSAGQTVKLSKQDIKSLIATSSGMDFESQNTKVIVDDDECLKLIDYDSYFTLLEKRLPETKSGILHALAADDLIRKQSGGWEFLNLGAILFAKDLRVFKELKRKAIRVIVYKESTRVNAIKEQEGAKGYASGFEGLINYIMDQLPTNEIIENALRKKVKVFPEVSIREFVANALIHQDFSITGTSVLVEIFTDRLEITNPGVPLVEINRFIDTAPKSRNETLASLMRRLNICEERGSGIDRAISAVELFQLPAPKFIRGDDYTRVILYAPTSLTRMNIEDRVRACYQHTCLNYVNNHVVNNQSVRKRFKIAANNVSMASKIISETIDAGFIKPSDPGSSSKKFASYVPFWA
jgi:predicted HTH transcriptional regulator